MINLADMEPELAATLDLLRRGPADVDWLARQLRRSLQDARITPEHVAEMVTDSAVLVGRPDGSVCRLLDVLEGQALTQRTSARTAGRRDLWTDLSLRPLRTWALFEPLTLAAGGRVTAAEFGREALVADTDWLPDIPPGGLICLRVRRGQLEVEALADGVITTPTRQQVIRKRVARHLREEQWWASDVGPADRGPELNRAVATALLEDPELFAVPTLPLVELLHDVLKEHAGDDLLDETAAWEGGEVVSFGIAGMPQALYSELERRATAFGMSLDRYVVLALGHLAWRTPFAEDAGPWEKWELAPEPTKMPRLRPVPTEEKLDITESQFGI